MVTPQAVSISGDSIAFTSELERSNYLRGGLSVQGGYNDNIFTSVPAEGDASYTISPNIAFDMTRSRLKWNLNYSPGFTLYQRFTPEDQVDHVFSTNLQYEMSPHVTLTLQDNLAKTPSFSGLLQPGTATSGTNVLPTQTFVVVPPLVNTFSNNDSGQVTYQFSPNSMIGMGGSSAEMYFLGDSSLQGLSDSSQYGAQAFYTHRFNASNYVGTNYGFEDIVAHPSELETQVHSATLFYTLYFGRSISFSLFGGAQHADTQEASLLSFSEWSPTAGGGINLQGTRNSLALNASRSISTGGGLQGAVRSYLANAAFRHRFTQHLNGEIEGVYSTNDVLQTAGMTSQSGHTFLFSGSVQRSFGPHFSAQIGYSRVNQHYVSVPSISSNPNVNRGWVTISYQFERSLGR